MSEIPDDLPAIVAANVKRWTADDDGWRGYSVKDGRIVPDDRARATLGLVIERPGCRYADIGCANGALTGLVADKLGAGEVFGVDFSNMDLPKRIQFRAANLDSNAPLPFDTASMDVVTCMETLEHVHDTDRLAGELRRIVRPDGYVIVSVPRLDAILNIAMLTLGFLPPAVECSIERRYGSPDPSSRVSGHVSHFTKRGLSQLLLARGLAPEAFAQAGIYSSWMAASAKPPPIWQRAPLWLASKLPMKQDVLIFRARPR